MEISNKALLRNAVEATKKVREVADTRDDWRFMGYVGAALVTKNGNIFTGINVELMCGMGFCAEHSAVAEMVKSGETEIAKIVAATAAGSVLPPCGRCREMLYQIDERNLEAEVIVGPTETVLLRDLLPRNWQNYIDVSLRN